MNGGCVDGVYEWRIQRWLTEFDFEFPRAIEQASASACIRRDAAAAAAAAAILAESLREAIEFPDESRARAWRPLAAACDSGGGAEVGIRVVCSTTIKYNTMGCAALRCTEVHCTAALH